jgi:hypothetical protein
MDMVGGASPAAPAAMTALALKTITLAAMMVKQPVASVFGRK